LASPGKRIEDRLQSAAIADPYQRAVLNVMHTGSVLQGMINDVLKPFGLSEPQYNVLRILRGQKGSPMNLYQIGERMVHPDSNVSRIIDKLERKELVVRKGNDENRRRVDITITARGLETLTAIDPVLLSEVSEAFKSISPAELDALNEILDRLRP